MMNIKILMTCVILLEISAITNAFEVNLDVKEKGMQSCAVLDPAELVGINLEKYRSTLVVNFDGEGVTTTSVKQGVYHDHDKNYFSERSAWITSNNGFLVFQKNRLITWSTGIENQVSPNYENKIIDSFDALRQYDVNQNSIIDKNDVNFNDLFIWINYSRSGRIIHRELKSLRDLEIREIMLNIECEPFAMLDQHENIYKVKSKVIRSDGSTLDIYEVWLKSNLTDTRDDTPQIAISDDIKKLPNLLGFGTLMSLHKSLAVDQTGKMKGLIQSIMQRLKNGAPFDSVVEDVDILLVLWARAGEENVNLQPENLMQQKRYILEKSAGYKLVGFHDGVDHIKPYEKSYSIMFDYLFDQLIYNTKILGYIKAKDIKRDKQTSEYNFYTAKLTDALLLQFSQSPSKDFLKILQVFKKVYGKKEINRQIYGQVIRELVEANSGIKQLLDRHQVEIPKAPDKKTRIPKKQRKELENGSYIEWG